MSEPSEIHLDPENWEQARALGHRMLDDMIDQMATVRDRPAWQSVPEETRSSLNEDTPLSGQPLEKVYQQFLSDILPYPTGNQHPRFFGWVMGNGTMTGMLADMLASGMNPHLAGYDQSAALVEKQVIKWLSELMGFPADASGLLVSGGTMANINGLTVARNTKTRDLANFDIREHGLAGSDAPRLTVYGSDQLHSWIYKACETMGMGRRAFRSIKSDANFRLDIPATRAAIKADLADGFTPFCLIATAGTVSTGAIDDLTAMRALADEFNLWLHIDGAFGSLAALASDDADLVAGQELADSIAFDLHKWGYMPFEAACVLVRDSAAQTDTYASHASYLNGMTRGIAVDITHFADRGLQLSRGFRALKVWMSLKEQGAHKIGRVIQQNIDQARHLETLVRAHPELELVSAASLNIVCLRYIGSGFHNTSEPAHAQTDALNQRVLEQVQISGIAVPSQGIIGGRFAIRVCITNHRTTRQDLEVLVDAIIQEGRRAAPEFKGQLETV
jgi:aromatic-L-amino-acid decarboxylase